MPSPTTNDTNNKGNNNNRGKIFNTKSIKSTKQNKMNIPKLENKYKLPINRYRPNVNQNIFQIHPASIEN